MKHDTKFLIVCVYAAFLTGALLSGVFLSKYTALVLDPMKRIEGGK